MPCRKNNLLTARVLILLKSRASLTCFRACFLPSRAKDLSAPRHLSLNFVVFFFKNIANRELLEKEQHASKVTISTKFLTRRDENLQLTFAIHYTFGPTQGLTGWLSHVTYSNEIRVQSYSIQVDC